MDMKVGVLGMGIALAAAAAVAVAETPASLLAGYRTEAGQPPDPARGQRLFTQTQGREWSCASCHQALPVSPGRHAATGKTIETLAPAFNPQRFSDAGKVEKLFRRNCKDVLARECSAGEKADVLAWLITLRN